MAENDIEKVRLTLQVLGNRLAVPHDAYESLARIEAELTQKTEALAECNRLHSLRAEAETIYTEENERLRRIEEAARAVLEWHDNTPPKSVHFPVVEALRNALAAEDAEKAPTTPRRRRENPRPR